MPLWILFLLQSAHRMPLRAVIFDYGMVLTEPANALAHQLMLGLTRLDAAAFEHAYWLHRPAYDRGTLHGLTYWQALARTANIMLEPVVIAQLIELDIRMWTDLNPTMMRWVEQLHAADLRTAILSNMSADVLAHMRANFDWLRRFDQLTWSCELDMLKPEPGIYRHTLERLGVRAEEALFLDDREENIEGARAVGLHALVFRTVAQLRDDLTRAGLAQQLPPLLAESFRTSANIPYPFKPTLAGVRRSHLPVLPETLCAVSVRMGTRSTISRSKPCNAGTCVGVLLSRRILWICKSERIWPPRPT